jgi:hypothetical protein
MAKLAILIILVLLSFLLLNEYSKTPSEQLLVSKTWVLSSYGLRDNKKHRLKKGVHYYLNLYEYPNVATINTSCPAQDTLGKYKINAQGLFILSCSSTNTQRCPDDDGSKHYRQERDFIKAVIFGSEPYIRGNKLSLISSDGEQLIFTGVTNAQRKNFFEQLLVGFLVILSC